MPVALDPPAEAPPATSTQPDPQRPWWRRHAPWAMPKTRNAAPADDGELLIDNRTRDIWSVHLGYRDLGAVNPHQQQRVRVVKTGMLTARQLKAAPGTGYLMAHLNPSVQTVEIRGSIVKGVPLYDLRLIEAKSQTAEQP